MRSVDPGRDHTSCTISPGARSMLIDFMILPQAISYELYKIARDEIHAGDCTILPGARSYYFAWGEIDGDRISVRSRLGRDHTKCTISPRAGSYKVYDLARSEIDANCMILPWARSYHVYDFAWYEIDEDRMILPEDRMILPQARSMLIVDPMILRESTSLESSSLQSSLLQSYISRECLEGDICLKRADSRMSSLLSKESERELYQDGALSREMSCSRMVSIDLSAG
jgi:hypothetical protein